MQFVRHLIGGAVIIVIATLIGIGENIASGRSMPLVPKKTKRLPVAETTEPHPGGETSPDYITEAELAAGEVTGKRVRQLAGTGTVILIDARSEAEYAEGYIDGAMNVPYEHFVDYYDELMNTVPMDVTVICYCRSVTCDLSDHLAEELRIAGYDRVVVYRGGWDEWISEGGPQHQE